MTSQFDLDIKQLKSIFTFKVFPFSMYTTNWADFLIINIQIHLQHFIIRSTAMKLCGLKWLKRMLVVLSHSKFITFVVRFSPTNLTLLSFGS